MADADADTESLPHYDVEVTPISSQPEIKYELLKKATVNALTQFQTDCSGSLPAEFTNYLDVLMGEIDSTHKAHEIHIASSSSSSFDQNKSLEVDAAVPTTYKSIPIQNIATYCYLNAALQLLYSIDAIVEWVNKNPKANYTGHTENPPGVINALYSVLNAMTEAKGTSKNFLKVEDVHETNMKTLSTGTRLKEQEDMIVPLNNIFGNNKEFDAIFTSQEVIYFSCSVNKEDSDTLPTNVQDSITAHNNNIIKTHIHYQHDTTSSTTNQPYLICPTANKTGEHLQNYVDAYFEPTLENESNLTDKRCDNTGTFVMTKRFIIPNEQTHLIIQLQRGSVGGSATQLDYRTVIPDHTITIPTPDNNVQFKLKGLSLVPGATSSDGHYTYISYENGLNRAPIIYNDSTVSTVKANDANQDIYNRKGYIFLYEKLSGAPSSS